VALTLQSAKSAKSPNWDVALALKTQNRSAVTLALALLPRCIAAFGIIYG
jgi:hypothetical protein